MNTRTRSKGNSVTTRSTRANQENKQPTYCTCRGPDDGTPMVMCGICKEWYHFKCVNLEEETAHDLDIYVCPPCTQSTGRQSVMTWEGSDGYESPKTTKRKQTKPKPTKKPTVVKEEEEPVDIESEHGSSSDEDYIDIKKPKRLTKNYDSDASDDDAPPTTSHLKRKASGVDRQPTKRKKSVSVDAPNRDAARKYCLSKLSEVFTQIFLRYPPEENPGEEELKSKANKFATQVEDCIFEKYAENHTVSQQYKARFSMLQFNLSKEDRVSLHKGITAGEITPTQLAVMSSAELASEQMQQSIQIAEKEALEHSILKKAKVPTAKITHKGLEDIEDQNGVLISDREREEQAEEEKRERERLSRIKSAEQHQRQQRASSVSVPSDSPIVAPPTPQWGGPPSASSPTVESPSSSAPFGFMRQPPNPLFVNTAPEPSVREPELNLADLINIDEEPLGEEANPAPEPTPPTPVAVPSPPPPEPSFDLNSLWNAPAPAPQRASPEPVPQTDTAPFETQTTTDHDFDMLLEDKQEELARPSAAEQFNSSPTVWTGVISMPLDSTIPQDIQVIARQAGGRSLKPDSRHWRVLFPTETLRIDGRVPVENSLKFLLQTRLNSSKEMISAAFSPASEAAAEGFRTMSDFLISKSRHGLIFPWGNRPKDPNPGRELYVIPLLSTEPLPECIELLDDLKLPKERTENYLIGVWILGKGKLDAAIAAAATPPLHTSTPPQTILHHAPPPSAISPPAHSPIAPPPVPRPVEPATLAAEVASLTPEQIQAMLQMLTRQQQQQQQQQPVASPHLQPPQPMQWQDYSPPYGHSTPAPYGGFSPPPFPPQQPPQAQVGHFVPAPSQAPSWNHGYDHGRDGDHGGGDWDNHRGYRGGTANRARRRGGGGGRGMDSNWSRRK